MWLRWWSKAKFTWWSVFDQGHVPLLTSNSSSQGCMNPPVREWYMVFGGAASLKWEPSLLKHEEPQLAFTRVKRTKFKMSKIIPFSAPGWPQMTSHLAVFMCADFLTLKWSISDNSHFQEASSSHGSFLAVRLLGVSHEACGCWRLCVCFSPMAFMRTCWHGLPSFS